MKTRSSWIILALVVFAATESAICWNLHLQIAELQKTAAHKPKDKSGSKQKKSASGDLAPVTSSIEESKSVATPAETKGPASAEHLDKDNFALASSTEALNDVVTQKLLLVALKGGLDARYSSLFKTLADKFSFTPEQLDKFKTLLAQKQETLADAVAASAEQGITTKSDPAAFKRLMEDALAAQEQLIKAELDPSAYAEYKSYQETLPERNAVNWAQQVLGSTESPLSAEQSAALLKVLVAGRSSDLVTWEPGDDANDVLKVLLGTKLAPLTDITKAQAATLLTPQQTAALQESMNADKQLRKLLKGKK